VQRTGVLYFLGEEEAMSEVKRYEPNLPAFDHEDIEEHSLGRYVLYTDHAALAARCKAAEEERDRFREALYRKAVALARLLVHAQEAWDSEEMVNWCPWCQRSQDDTKAFEHAPDCALMLARWVNTDPNPAATAALGGE
jgi:hypothetical protein